MKTLLFILTIFLTSCSTCEIVLSQNMHDQILYFDQNCMAVLPDYRTKINVTGGCGGITVSQMPVPGTIITQNTSVTIKALSTNLKFDEDVFNVALVDTITPKISVLITSVDELMQKSRTLYDAADRMVGLIDSVFANQILVIASWDSAGVRHRIVNFTDTFNLDILK